MRQKTIGKKNSIFFDELKQLNDANAKSYLTTTKLIALCFAMERLLLLQRSSAERLATETSENRFCRLQSSHLLSRLRIKLEQLQAILVPLSSFSNFLVENPISINGANPTKTYLLGLEEEASKEIAETESYLSIYPSDTYRN